MAQKRKRLNSVTQTTELTLEKMGIRKELNDLKVAVTKMCGKMDKHEALCHNAFINMNRIVDRHDLDLNGSNGMPGMKKEVDRLNQNEKRRVWNLRALWVGLVGTLGTVVATLFNHRMRGGQ